MPVGEALIILKRSKEHNTTDAVSQWLRALKVIEDEIPGGVIQRYSQVKLGGGGGKGEGGWQRPCSTQVGGGKTKVGASDEVGGILHVKHHLYLYLTAAYLLSALPRRLARWDVPTLIHYASRGWGSFSRRNAPLSRAHSDQHQTRRRSRMTIFKNGRPPLLPFLPSPTTTLPRCSRDSGIHQSSDSGAAGPRGMLRRPLQRTQALLV